MRPGMRPLTASTFPRPVRVTDERGAEHDGWVRAAQRDLVTGRWRGFVDYIDRDDRRTGGHYLLWVDQECIRLRPDGQGAG
jgi:hypothetical protein